MSLLDRYQALVIDLDGTVFRTDQVIPEAVGLLRRMVRDGPPVVFVTNNSARPRTGWVGMLTDAKVEIDEQQVLNSAQAATWVLADGAGTPPRTFVIGEQGLRSALEDAGVPQVDSHEGAEAVVVGWDRRLTWERLKDATLAIHAGARFVATNADPIYPAPEGPWPGTGATLAYLQATTGVAPEVAGKPQTPLFELAAERLKVGDKRVLLVGDSMNSDMVGAARMGWDSCLVLTGVSSWSSLVGARATPTWVIGHLGDLSAPEPPLIRHAREADLSTIRELLAAVEFDTRGAAARLENTLVAERPDGQVVGTASWEPVGNAAHLRGITVAAAERGHGTGSHLVAQALDELLRSGVEWVYLLTPSAERLFKQLGFWEVTRERVPDGVLETAQFGGAEDNATALVRRLAEDTSRR